MATRAKKPAPAEPVEPSGPPRWTYTAGAIVGVVGMVWAIVSVFVPKPDAGKPAVAAAAPTVGSASVGVSGSGNVGVVVNSGTINVGSPQGAAAASGVGKP